MGASGGREKCPLPLHDPLRISPPEDGPKKKLAYLEQREWDGMEAKILEAEGELDTWRNEMQEAGPDAKRLTEAYERMQQSQRVVDELYGRWAELEAKVAR